LARINRELIGKAEALDSLQRVESTCYYPLLLFNREVDCLAAKLRPGNAHSADESWLMTL
jgi:hypothetical protein